MAYGTGSVRLAGMPDGGFPSEIDSNAKIRQVDENVLRLMDVSIDLIRLFSRGGDPFGGFVATSNKYEWMEDDRYSRRPTHGGLLNEAGPSTLTVTGQAHRYPVGTMLQFENELVRVLAVVDADTLTVARGVAGTTVAAHSSNVEVMVAGASMAENDDWVIRPTAIPSFSYNYVQRFSEKITLTWERQSIPIYGYKANQELARLVRNAMETKMVEVEGGLVHGRRHAGTSSADPPTSGGMSFWITSANGSQVTDKGGAALTLKDIDDALQAIAYDVGPDGLRNPIIVCDYWGKRKISSFAEPSSRRDETETEYGVVIDSIRTTFGRVRVLQHTAIPKGTLYIFGRPELVKIGHMRFANGRGKMADFPVNETTGPRDSRVIFGTYCFKFEGLRSMGVIKNYSTTS